MIARRLAGIALLLFFAIVHPSRTSLADELQAYEDTATGLTILIPRSLAGQQKSTRFGLNWHSDDLSIDTLAFPPERSLQNIYETMKRRPNRKITRDESGVSGFVLEGIDRDGMRFIVHVRDEEPRRGLSVVYKREASGRIERMAREIADAFQSGGGSVEPEVATADYLRQARAILAQVAAAPDKSKELWPEFGAAIRKYRLRVGRQAAKEAVRLLFTQYPASPLRSAAWGTLPLGVMANLAQNEYSTIAIYGSKSEHPAVRQELASLLAEHPNDPFAFVAHYGTGAFDEAIAAAARSGMPVAMLHYAAGHKKLAQLLERTIPNLSPPATAMRGQNSPADRDCPTDDAPSPCFFYETHTVQGRLGAFLERASKTDQARVRDALLSNRPVVNEVIEHFEQAARLGRDQPHEDDAEYYLGVIFRFLGQRNDAVARFDRVMTTKRGVHERDYFDGARRQMIQILLEMPADKRVSTLVDSKNMSADPSLWYVLARDAYRRHDYETTIRISETGLERSGVEIWRLPVTTDSERIEGELRRLLRPGPEGHVDIHLGELVYLLNASREMQRFVQVMQEQPSKIEPKYVRSLVQKYSLLTTNEEDLKKLQGGQLGQHRDLRQGLHMTGLALSSIPQSASPALDKMREWLFYRRIRILLQYDPKSVEAQVKALEQAYPKSDLLDDAYVELLYTQAFVLKSPADSVSLTFRLIAERFASGNAADNAYNWYAVYLRCKKDYAGARRVNLEILRKFTMTRHAVYAAARMAKPEGCEFWVAPD